jgi:hypothetical protein
MPNAIVEQIPASVIISTLGVQSPEDSLQLRLEARVGVAREVAEVDYHAAGNGVEISVPAHVGAVAALRTKCTAGSIGVRMDERVASASYYYLLVFDLE